VTAAAKIREKLTNLFIILYEGRGGNTRVVFVKHGPPNNQTRPAVFFSTQGRSANDAWKRSAGP
jgi:hypothetical protein